MESVWQDHMNAVYTKWQQNTKLPYETVLMRCNQVEFAAVLLGNFNNQVCNGGFQQWVDNGYATQGRYVLRILKDIIQHPSTPSNKIDALESLYKRVQKLLKYVKPGLKNKGFCGDYWKDRRSKSGAAFASEQDDWYYEQDFEELFECYIHEIDKELAAPQLEIRVEKHYCHEARFLDRRLRSLRADFEFQLVNIRSSCKASD